MPSIEKEPIYDVYCISRRQYQRFLNILFWGCLSGAVGCVDVWFGARRSCHGSVDLLYPSVCIYCMNLHQFLILRSAKAMMFVKCKIANNKGTDQNARMRRLVCVFVFRMQQSQLICVDTHITNYKFQIYLE